MDNHDLGIDTEYEIYGLNQYFQQKIVNTFTSYFQTLVSSKDSDQKYYSDLKLSQTQRPS